MNTERARGPDDQGMQGRHPELRQARIAVISRCARTLFVFRRSLIHALADEGAHVAAIGAAGDGYEERLRREGIQFEDVSVAPRSINPRADLQLVIQLVRLFARLRPQVVHAFTIKPAIYATLAASLAGVPVRIVTVTGLGHAFTTAHPIVRRTVESMYRLALRRASLTFFQNEIDRDLFVQKGLVAAQSTRCVPGSGVDLARYVPVPLPVESGAPPAFLMIARLLKEKGVMEFLEAASIVRAQSPELTFKLVGGLDERNPSALTAAEVSALRDSRVVQWIDEVLDVQPLIAASDVVVLPSYREGLPRSLLEAAAMGRALIATNVPGCRDIVHPGETGYLVEPRSPESLAQAMLDLAGKPKLIEVFGRRARSMVVARFDERRVIEETIDAYVSLLQSFATQAAARG